MKGFDPAGWVTVDQKTGEVTTTTSLDRESPYVKDGIYNVTVLVVDNGMTSRYSLFYGGNLRLGYWFKQILQFVRISFHDGYGDPHHSRC